MHLRIAIGLLVTSYGAVADAQQPSLDVVGIRVGMPVDSAITRIAVHNRELPTNPPYRASLPNVPGRVVSGYLTRGSRMSEVQAEEIKFGVSLPPSKPVVTTIARNVLYKPDSRPTYAVMLDALRKKYGTHDFSSFKGSHYWFFDAKGSPVSGNARCGLNLGGRDDPEGVVSMGGGPAPLADAAAHDRIAALCGQYVRVQLGFDFTNAELVSGFTIVMNHAPLRAIAHHLTIDYLTKLETQRKAQELDAAKKRDPKCCD